MTFRRVRFSPGLFFLPNTSLCGNQTVKFRVFMPPQVSKEPPTYSPRNLSVYRISEISDSEVWEIGQEHVQTEGRLIKARD